MSGTDAHLTIDWARLDGMPDAPALRSIAVTDDVELQVREWTPTSATGAPILLVHGLASNARLWDGCAAALVALGHPVAALDQRGHGRSSKPDHGYDFATLVDDLHHVVEALGYDRPVLAGQSWGGNVVVEFAARRPDETRGVVAVDGGTIELGDRFGSWDEAATALRPPDLSGIPATRMREMMRSGHPDWPESGIDGAMGNFEVLADGTIRSWLTLDRHLMILRELFEHRPSDRFASLRVPVLFVPADSGAAAWTHDKEASIARAEAAMTVPARTVWFSPADHDLHAQFPERLAHVIHDECTTGLFA